VVVLKRQLNDTHGNWTILFLGGRHLVQKIGERRVGTLLLLLFLQRFQGALYCGVSSFNNQFFLSNVCGSSHEHEVTCRNGTGLDGGKEFISQQSALRTIDIEIKAARRPHLRQDSQNRVRSHQ